MTLDEAMIVHAANRGPVVYFDPRTRRNRLATLIAWRETRARIEFPRGTRATVNRELLTVPQEVPT